MSIMLPIWLKNSHKPVKTLKSLKLVEKVLFKKNESVKKSGQNEKKKHR